MKDQEVEVEVEVEGPGAGGAADGAGGVASLLSASGGCTLSLK